ncbi:MAG TPA: archease [Actinomycetota bacterium]|nr:archease [Actinomycetota bacterium]
MARFEILEHTADVGIKAEAVDLSGVFEQATLGLLDIIGTWAPSAAPGDAVEIAVEAGDAGALLVDWLGEVLYVHDSRDAVVTSLDMSEVTPERAVGRIGVAPRDEEAYEGGTQVKAITYHRLAVEETPDGWTATVYVDV